ncbi:MAG: glycosyltransferase [Deltaproteobacteria bacterium]|nr:glycosyltransferase [Deltaproteobacteria bacterium]
MLSPSQILFSLILVNLFAWSVAFANFLFFFRRRKIKETVFSPRVSILKIFYGVEEGLAENLESFTRIDYPHYELILSVLDGDDPAIPLLKRFMDNHPHCPIKLVVRPSQLGPNRQVCNFYNAFLEASGEILVLSDSDTIATPDYIRQLIKPLEDRRVGLVSAVPLMVGARGWAGYANTLTYNLMIPLVDVLFQYLTPVGIGPAMAFRREAYLKTGGFKAIARKLTTDQELAKLFALAGYKTRVAPYLIRTHERNQGIIGHAGHTLRWMVAVRVASPVAYHFFILTCQSLFALLLLFLEPGSPYSWGMLLMVIAYRTVMPSFLDRVIYRQGIPFLYFFSVLIADLLFPFVWLAGYFQRTVVWGKYRFVVENGIVRAEEISETGNLEGEVRVNPGYVP